MKKKLSLAFALVLILVLAACAGQQQAASVPQGSDQSAQSSGQGGTDNQGAPANQGGSGSQGNSLDSRLAMGILELEGTSNAVTADQAKQLVPLFQQLQSTMGSFGNGNGGANSGDSGSNATPDANATPQAPAGSGSGNASDMQSLYQQIEAVLTSDQTQAIEALSLSQSDIQNLMQQYNIQYTPGAAQNGGNYPTQSPDQISTRQAERQTQEAANGGTPQPGFSGTPGAGGRGGFGGGYDRLFLDPLITLLQQRAGS